MWFNSMLNLFLYIYTKKEKRKNTFAGKKPKVFVFVYLKFLFSNPVYQIVQSNQLLPQIYIYWHKLVGQTKVSFVEPTPANDRNTLRLSHKFEP